MTTWSPLGNTPLSLSLSRCLTYTCIHKYIRIHKSFCTHKYVHVPTCQHAYALLFNLWYYLKKSFTCTTIEMSFKLVGWSQWVAHKRRTALNFFWTPTNFKTRFKFNAKKRLEGWISWKFEQSSLHLKDRNKIMDVR